VSLRRNDAAVGFSGFPRRARTALSDFPFENGNRGHRPDRGAGRIVGVRGNTPAGPVEIRAELVVGADGRNSVVRELSGLVVEDVGAPMDVLWMRLSKRPDDPDLMIYADRGRAFVMFDRGGYWQCGFSVAKGTAKEIQTKGIEALRAAIVALAPPFHDRMTELRDWNDVKLLTVRVDRLRRWYRPGLVCLGDAAHAMSPVGGVGINLAIQDAVAAANILARPLAEGRLSVRDLERIQRRREFPTRLTQRVQAAMRRQHTSRKLPWPVRLLERTTIPRRMRTRFIGIGIRPEHVRTPDVSDARIEAGDEAIPRVPSPLLNGDKDSERACETAVGHGQ
jgi:2-polyprenyl-6-methoxyphenol hydroxylase-like FAD-dependent oxidoreductase